MTSNPYTLILHTATSFPDCEVTVWGFSIDGATREAERLLCATDNPGFISCTVVDNNDCPPDDVACPDWQPDIVKLSLSIERRIEREEAR